jgi:type II secretory pathway component GspD/PulD (secretin)
MKRGPSIIVLASVMLGGLAARAEESTRLRVFDLGLTDPRTAAEVVRPLLSPAGRLYEDPAQHRLIVSDRPEVLDRVAAALRTIEVVPRNVRIRVRTRLERQVRIVGAEGTVRGGVTIRGGASRSRTVSNAEQQLLVVSGGKASLRVAEETPYAEWFWSWGLGRGLWTGGTAWHDVETSLVVEPRVLGDGTLRVRVTPRFDYVVDRETQSTVVNELSTEVVVREGEEVDLGGLPFADSEFRERFLLGFNSSGETVRVEMTLRAHVE